MHYDKDTDFEFERKGEETIYAIQNALGCDEELAYDLQEFLEEKYNGGRSYKEPDENEYSEYAQYKARPPSDSKWYLNWHSFVNDLKSKRRFFNKSAHEFLSSLFDGIENMSTSDGEPVVIEAGPESKSEPERITGFYRARVFHSKDKLKEAMKRPDLNLGPPPSELAKAGRMNAFGISVFYGAVTAEGAIAEVRPPVGSLTLAGRFDLVRKIRLLDFNALSKVSESGSIFNPKYAERFIKSQFLRSFTNQISLPVMPTDEDLEYLATQAVVEFLANALGTKLDGVLFPSAQTAEDTVNVVLFRGSSEVKKLSIPQGTEIEASCSMTQSVGPEPWYQVTETLPKEKTETDIDSTNSNGKPTIKVADNSTKDELKSTLRLNLDSLEVVDVEKVKYKTNSHKVYRDRR